MSEHPRSRVASTVPPGQAAMPRWKRVLPGGAAIAAGFTTLCCLGVSAAVSLTSAIGAGFFVKDAVLRPALIVTVAITTIGSAFTFLRHRNPIPVLVTVAAGGWIYWFVFHATKQAGRGDHMGDNMAQPSNLVWIGLVALIGVQAYDAYRTARACRFPRAAVGGTAEPYSR